MRVLQWLLAPVLIALVVTGCNYTDDETPVAGAGTEATTVTVGSGQYVVPDDITVESTSIAGADAIAMSAGDNQEVGSFVAQKSVANVATIMSATTLASSAVSSELQNAVNAIEAATSYISTLSTQTEQVYSDPVDYAIGDYQLTTVNSISPLDLAGAILDTVVGGGTSGFPGASASAVSDTSYRMIMAVVEYGGYYYYIVVVVPQTSYSKFATLAYAMTSGNNITNASTTVNSASDGFTGLSGGSTADFLFVVDDSGSMSNDQEAVAQAGSDFAAVIENSGLDYHLAIISTGLGIDSLTGNANRVLNSIGIIENNITQFEESVILGSSGSSTETGIYNAEQALLSTAQGDTVDGVLTSEFSFPRSGTSLSVVIISDEASQYTYRSGGVEFNTSNNLFVDRNYKVFSIVDENDNSYSQYDDLATATGGLTGNIANTDSNGTLDFSQIMANIATQAGGAASQFNLSHTGIIPSTISVTVNGTSVVSSNSDGWQYVESSNAIVFYGSAIPQTGSSIVVSYDYQGS